MVWLDRVPEIATHGGGASRVEATFMSSQEHLEKVEGTVKWFDARKGFGFIVGPAGQDVFVHYSVIEQEHGFRTLKDGERVQYGAAQGAKGWAATYARALVRAELPTA